MEALDEKLNRLLKVGDNVFGRYQFLFSTINNKLTEEKREEYIIKSLECGKNTAIEYKDETAEDLLKKFNINILIDDENDGGNLLGYFKYPNKIVIHNLNIFRIHKKLAKNGITLSCDKIKEVVIAHELFHYLENAKPEKFFTQTEKITTFKFLKHEFKSKIIALSEIAAMAFAKEFANLSFSPYVLDYVLLSCIDKEKAYDMALTVFELDGDIIETNDL